MACADQLASTTADSNLKIVQWYLWTIYVLCGGYTFCLYALLLTLNALKSESVVNLL